MNDRTLVVVHCWSGDRRCVERMLPIWKRHGEVLLVSPQDAPLTVPTSIPGGGENDWKVFCRYAGGNGWMGTHVPHRLIAHWRIALEYDADWFFLNEWDSFCSKPELPAELFVDEDMFWSIEVDENWAVGDVGSGLRASFPYFMHRKLLREMVECAEAILDDVTSGPDLDLYGNKSPDGFTMHLLKVMGHEKHRRYTDAIDLREKHDGPFPTIVHWHGLTDPDTALLAAGIL